MATIAAASAAGGGSADELLRLFVAADGTVLAVHWAKLALRVLREAYADLQQAAEAARHTPGPVGRKAVSGYTERYSARFTRLIHLLRLARHQSAAISASFARLEQKTVQFRSQAWIADALLSAHRRIRSEPYPTPPELTLTRPKRSRSRDFRDACAAVATALCGHLTAHGAADAAGGAFAFAPPLRHYRVRVPPAESEDAGGAARKKKRAPGGGGAAAAAAEPPPSPVLLLECPGLYTAAVTLAPAADGGGGGRCVALSWALEFCADDSPRAAGLRLGIDRATARRALQAVNGQWAKQQFAAGAALLESLSLRCLAEAVTSEAQALAAAGTFRTRASFDSAKAELTVHFWEPPAKSTAVEQSRETKSTIDAGDDLGAAAGHAATAVLEKLDFNPHAFAVSLPLSAAARPAITRHPDPHAVGRKLGFAGGIGLRGLLWEAVQYAARETLTAVRSDLTLEGFSCAEKRDAGALEVAVDFGCFHCKLLLSMHATGDVIASSFQYPDAHPTVVLPYNHLFTRDVTNAAIPAAGSGSRAFLNGTFKPYMNAAAAASARAQTVMHLTEYTCTAKGGGGWRDFAEIPCVLNLAPVVRYVLPLRDVTIALSVHTALLTATVTLSPPLPLPPVLEPLLDEPTPAETCAVAGLAFGVAAFIRSCRTPPASEYLLRPSPLQGGEHKTVRHAVSYCVVQTWVAAWRHVIASGLREVFGDKVRDYVLTGGLGTGKPALWPPQHDFPGMSSTDVCVTGSPAVGFWALELEEPQQAQPYFANVCYAFNPKTPPTWLAGPLPNGGADWQPDAGLAATLRKSLAVRKLSPLPEDAWIVVLCGSLIPLYQQAVFLRSGSTASDAVSTAMVLRRKAAAALAFHAAHRDHISLYPALSTAAHGVSAQLVLAPSGSAVNVASASPLVNVDLQVKSVTDPRAAALLEAVRGVCVSLLLARDRGAFVEFCRVLRCWLSAAAKVPEGFYPVNLSSWALKLVGSELIFSHPATAEIRALRIKDDGSFNFA
ncbi:hypothetical protein DIPPA_06857 [Diplonema papillatum]|nr:hypothetical protein DIPPA_06857 [Diplonema papillatum]